MLPAQAALGDVQLPPENAANAFMALVEHFLAEHPVKTDAVSQEGIRWAAAKVLLYQTVSPERLKHWPGPGSERLAAILFILFAEDGLVHEEESILGMTPVHLYEILESVVHRSNITQHELMTAIIEVSRFNDNYAMHLVQSPELEVLFRQQSSSSGPPPSLLQRSRSARSAMRRESEGGGGRCCGPSSTGCAGSSSSSSSSNVLQTIKEETEAGGADSPLPESCVSESASLLPGRVDSPADGDGGSGSQQPHPQGYWHARMFALASCCAWCILAVAITTAFSDYTHRMIVFALYCVVTTGRVCLQSCWEYT